MPNVVDLDRLKARMRNQSVVDINAYRAAADNTADTSATYVDPVTQKWLGIGVVLFALFLFVLRGGM